MIILIFFSFMSFASFYVVVTFACAGATVEFG